MKLVRQIAGLFRVPSTTGNTPTTQGSIPELPEPQRAAKKIDLLKVLERGDSSARRVAEFLELFNVVAMDLQSPNLMPGGAAIDRALDQHRATPKGKLFDRLSELGLRADNIDDFKVVGEKKEDGGIITLKTPTWKLVVTSSATAFTLEVESPSISGLLAELPNS